MNLKTHTAYPEIQIDEDFSFSVRLIDGKGITKFRRNGKGKSREDATKLALEALAPEADKFLIEEGN